MRTFIRRSAAGALWLTVALVAACELLAAPGAARPGSTNSGEPYPSAPADETRSITVYLPRRFRDDTLGLQAVSRVVPASQDSASAALEALIAGPSGDERADDFQYPLDRRTRIHGVRVEHGVATLDLGAEIDRLRGRPFSELVYWSIVYTLTEVPGVERVALRREGEPLAALGDPPFPVPALAGRADAPAWARPRAEPRSPSSPERTAPALRR